MMKIDVSLVFAPADREVAREVAHRLEHGAQARVWLEEVLQPVTESWDQGMSSAGVIVLLSPHSVPADFELHDWSEWLEYMGSPPIARLLVSRCKYPARLERSLFFRWSDENVLRKLHRWAIKLHGDMSRRPAATAYEGSTEELWLWLADRPGIKRVYDLQQARHFANEAADYFRDVIVVPCSGRSMEMIVGEIALSIGVKLSGSPEDACEQVSVALANARVLLLLEGMEQDAPFYFEGQASVLYAPAGEPERAPAIETMAEAFVHWPSRGPECGVYVPHVERALLGEPWHEVMRLGRAAFAFLKGHDRGFEAAHIASVLQKRAEEVGDSKTRDWAREELSWMIGGEGVMAPIATGGQMRLFF